MKTKIRIAAAFIALGVAALFILNLNCGSGSAGDYPLTGAPTGFVFTNTSGNQIDKMSSGGTAQLRDTTGRILLQFFVNGIVNFQNVVAGRDSTKTLIHFPSAIDKNGISGYLLLFFACNATTDEVRVCPSATAMSEVAGGCTDELTLNAANPTSGAYTWANASTRTGSDDCQVQANTGDFGTGAFGVSTGGVVLTEKDFPNVGVCATGTVDVTGNELKNALAAATAFTFWYQDYAIGANVPFICGKQDVWDPSDPNAFSASTTLNMTNTISDILTGTYGSVFICNTGFSFTPTPNWGFHDATTFRGEITFTAAATTYRGRLRFTVTGNDAGKVLADLGLAPIDVDLFDSNNNQLTTAGDVRDLFVVNPTNITIKAKTNSTERITATGGFICAGTE